MNNNIIRPIALCFLAAIVALLNGCSHGDAPGSTLDEMNFNVRDSLLAPAIADAQLGISFRTPRNWVKVDQHTIDSARDVAARKMGSNFDRNETVLGVYVDSTSNSALAVMRLDSFDVADSSASVKQYVQKLRAANPELSVQTALFRKGDYRVHQVRAVSPAVVTLRLTFDNLTKAAPVFAFNYIIPGNIYSAKALEIESSVGSLQPLSSIH